MNKIIRGVRFLAPKKYSKYLWDIFQSSDLSKYTWYIDQTEVLYFNKEEKRVSSDFFSGDTLTGAQIKERIMADDYYVYLANIQAFPAGEPKEEILTYDDFLKSKCEILLLWADSIYVDLYSKDEEFLKNVHQMCIQNGFEKTEYISDENDERTALSLA